MSIKIEHLTKKFGMVVVIPELNVEFQSGKISVLLGPSGCGKTTTLRCIAGLERPTSGRILLEGKPLFDSNRNINLQPEERGLGMVFQSYAIWPHMTVFENVAVPLRARSTRGVEVARRVREALDIVGLAGLADRSATQLSGGQQQRVAIARCLVGSPQLILLDEPLSNLDAKLRIEMRREIKDLQRRLGSTMLFVTHDQQEAMFLADEVFLFEKGEAVQSGSPRELYFKPANQFVAEFLGEANLIPAQMLKRDGAVDLLTVSGHLIASGAADYLSFDGDTVVVRPEAWQISPASQDAGREHFLVGKIADVTFLGDRLSMRIETPIGLQLASAAGHDPYRTGDDVQLKVAIDNIQMIKAGPRSGSV